MTLRRKKILKLASALFAVLVVLALGIGYSQYHALVRNLAGKISYEATLLLGQDVAIRDLSFGPSAGISLHHIVVNNPRGSEPGRLLTIERLSFGPGWRELLKGRIHLDSIEIRSPELTLITGEEGITNVSEKLKRLLSKKGAAEYFIDVVRIHSGTVSINHSVLTAVKDVDLSMKNISSSEDAKTHVNGTLSYAGNKVRVDGQLSPNSPDRNFGISLSAESFGFSAFKESLAKYGVATERMRADINLNAEGDLAKGCTVFSLIRLKGARTFSLLKDSGDTFLEGNAFYNIRENSLSVTALSLREGNVQLVQAKGSITDVGKHPSYRAEVRIGKIELSHFNVMKGMEIRGEVMSDTVRIQGSSGKMVSEISGAIRLKAGAIRSAAFHVEKADANLIFSTEKDIALNGMVSADILSLGGYRAEMPIRTSLSMRAAAAKEGIFMVSDIRFSPVSIKARDGTSFLFEGLESSLEGTLTLLGSFSGRVITGAKGMRIGTWMIPAFSSSLRVDWGKNLFGITEFAVESAGMKTSLGRIHVKRDAERSSYSAEVRDINMDYTPGELGVRNADLALRIRKEGEDMSGTAVVSGEVTFQGIPGKVSSGTIGLVGKEFSLDTGDAEVAGGRIRMKVRGRVPEGPFPLEAEGTLANIDMGILSNASQFRRFVYGTSGTLEHAAVHGVAGSLESLDGKIVVAAKDVSLMRRGSNKTALKGVGLNAEIACKGRDCVFATDMAAGNVRLEASGEVRKFAEREREVTVRVLLPETKLSEVRTSLWDSFPDGLLYAGLEGYLSSDVSLEHSGRGTKATGTLRLSDIRLEGENSEYSLGPINGSLPFQWDTARHQQNSAGIPSFEPSEFAALSRYYARKSPAEGYQRIALGSLRYGFRILDAADIWVKQTENGLNIGRFSATMFGGRLNGSAAIDFSEGLAYRVGILLEGLSLATLCEEVDPIKGYLSGKVDGTATIRGSGAGLSRLIGKADFWTYSSGSEKTSISREFLQRVGGPSLKAYLGDRSFDKGVMGLYLQNGFVIFRELEISHRNLMGVTDLSVKVAPFNNRIEIDQLLWTMTEAAQRAKERK